MTSPRIVVFAYSDLGHACLKFLLDRRENVVGVFTHKDQPGENPWFPSVERLSRQHAIPVSTEEDLKTPAAVALFKSWAPDLVFSFYYRQLIPVELLKQATGGAYNMHGSFLPKYRGRAPVNWAVLNGETTTGATLHVMEARADAGDIVDQESVVIGPNDTANMVQGAVTKAAVRIMERQIDALKMGTASRRPQIHGDATYFGRRTPEDGAIDWSWPAFRIHNLVRAVTHPYPGAFGVMDGEKVWVWKTRLCGTGATGAGMYVTCGDGRSLEILSLQPANEKEMTGVEYKERQRSVGRKKS